MLKYKYVLTIRAKMQTSQVLSFTVALIIFFVSSYFLTFCSHTLLVNCIEVKIIVLKAEQASRDSRLTKQDRYADLRRKKDEEREEQERLLVG